MMEREQIIKKIQSYIDEENSIINNEFQPRIIEKKEIGKIDLDDIFGGNDDEEHNDESNTKKRDESKFEFKFWNNNKDTFNTLLFQNGFSNGDFRTIKDAMNIIRGKYFMNDTYETVDKDFQDMCSLFIKFQLKKNDIGINNFLRYLNPESAYYKRVKALTLFRNLNNPFEEIESIRDEVCGLLYESSKLEPDSFQKSLNILKEYVERIFTIKYTDYDSRMDFILKSSNEWDIWFSVPTFSERILKYISGEEIEINKVEYEIENIPTEDTENINEKLLNEKEEVIHAMEKEKEEILKKQEELEIQLENTKNNYLETIKKKEEENEELKMQIEALLEANKISETKLEKGKTPKDEESIQERRKTYRITVVGGSDKTNKKYNQLLKTGFDGDLYEKFGIKKEQLGKLYGSYHEQSQKNFEKKIEDDLIFGNTDFVIILQTDHETGLYKLLNNSDFGSRITYFAEREKNNSNPKYSDQKFSKERFLYYLNRAIEKYERSEINNIS